MGQDRVTTQPFTPPGQARAASELIGLAGRSANTPFAGGFDISSDVLNGLINERNATNPANLRTLLPDNVFANLTDLATSGKPTDTTAQAAAQRAVIRNAASRAVDEALAAASAAGGRFSSSAARAAGGEAARVATQGELGIAQLQAQAQEAAAQRQVQATQLFGQLAQSVRAGDLDLARLDIASKQFAKTLDFEDFKRRFPDVAGALGAVFGSRMDVIATQQPSQFAQILQAAGPIIAAAIAAA